MKTLTIHKYHKPSSRLLVLSFIVCGLIGTLLISVRGSMVQVPLGGYEGDVSTRTDAGKGAVGVADWALIGRFVSGAETPKVGSEFQRADVAPKNTRGDGQITAADWVQAGRYATGLDPLVGAGGPTGPLAKAPGNPEALRDLRLVNAGISGNTLNISIEYEAADNENAFGFSVTFDPAVLGSPMPALGSGMTGATALFNTNQAAQGRIGFALAFPAPNTIAAGVRQLATLSFTILKVGMTTQLGFGNQPVGIEIVAPDATLLPAPNIATLDITINNPVPTLASISPNLATAGSASFTLTVNGTNFNNNSVVQWNGAARTTTFVSATQLTAAISAADVLNAGSATVTVFNPTPGGGTTSGQTFTINNPVPTLTSLGPATVVAGSAGFTLMVNGTNFNASSVVQVGGTNRATTFVSDTKLTVAMTQAEIANAGTLNITVVNPAPGGGTTAPQTLTITNPAPTLTSLSPTSATTGGAAFTLTVNGTNFVSTSKVRWNGNERATTFVNATQLTAAISADDIKNGGNVEITVFNPTPGGGTSGAITFPINNPAPTVTSLAPASIASGASAFSLTVNGTGFVPGSVVRWNGSDRATTLVSSTQLSAAITAADVASAGTAKVRVFNPTPAGGLSSELDFTILQTNPVPTLASISPSEVLVGGAQFMLTITGTNFVGTSVVRFNGSDRPTTLVSGTELKATINAADIASVGTASISVFNPTPGGGTTDAKTLTIRTAPPIVNVTPPLAGTSNLELKLNGAGYTPQSVILVNGQARVTRFVSATEVIVVFLPSDVAVGGTLKLKAFTPGGGESTETTLVINNPAPTITTLDPPSTFNTLPAFTLTVNGTGFVGPNGSIVRWNGSDRPTTFVSVTRLTAQISAADIANVGTAVVTVFNPTPGGGTSNAVNFAIDKLTGYEADLSPRPLGNNDGKVTIADWVQAGLFFVGADKPEIGSEFQRADCAPATTKGDGRLSIIDWVQAGRYAAGLDAVVVAGGPTQPVFSTPAASAVTVAATTEATPRLVRARGASFRRDQVVTLPIEMEAQGNENALAFSLNFDPKLLGFAEATLGEGATGATLRINRSEAGQGSIAVAIALPVGQTIAAGTRTAVHLRFIPLAGESTVTTSVSFSDQVVPREMADAFAQALPKAEYANASITLTGRAAANVIAANYVGGELAADSIASAFGSSLALTTEGAPASLPTTLGGTRVKVSDSGGVERDASLFFVSPNQVNYQIPAGTAEGIATVTITNRDGVETKGLLNITRVAPGVFSADATGKGYAAANAVYVRKDNSQVWESVTRFDVNTGRLVGNPIDVANAEAYLVLYGTGLRNRSNLANVKVRIDGIEASVEYAGAQGQYVGLDQLNVKLPKTLAGRGDVTVELSVDGKTANAVQVQIK
ncbi:MAG TPA: hypothetical protein VFZ34_00435 [Blastocatellia bacterium]|nr:hypothetical protein [Blastocatellia bacterium]